jgi:hypothetical protein
MENPRIVTRGNREEDPNEVTWTEQDGIWLNVDWQRTIFERRTFEGTWFWVKVNRSGFGWR